jgi:DNA replication factor GINS
MQLDTIREVSARERNSDSLQDPPPRFWEDAQEYVDILTERLEDATCDVTGAADLPAEVKRLREERKSALEVLESLADRRKAKVVKRASLAAKGLPTETEAMTDREQSLFETVRDEFETASLAPSLDDPASESAATADDEAVEQEVAE